MVYSSTWNAAFEAAPADVDDIGDGASEIRELKVAISERLNLDHYLDIAGTDVDHGEHRRVTFNAPISTPANVANKGFLYGKDVGAKIELHWEDEDGNELQLTTAGALNFAKSVPSGEMVLFYKDVIVTGYTLVAATNDTLVYITPGSVGGGTAGGTAKVGGTWTQPDHILTTAEIPAHTHTIAYGEGIKYFGTVTGVAELDDATSPITTSSTGGGTAHNHGTTWRPPGYFFTLQLRS